MSMPALWRRRTLLSALPAAVLAAFTASRAALAMGPSEETAVPERARTLPGTEELVGKKLRVLKPDSMVTMDYSDSRLNVLVDDSGTIQRFYIG